MQQVQRLLAWGNAGMRRDKTIGHIPNLMNEAETRAEHIDPALRTAG